MNHKGTTHADNNKPHRYNRFYEHYRRPDLCKYQANKTIHYPACDVHKLSDNTQPQNPENSISPIHFPSYCKWQKRDRVFVESQKISDKNEELSGCNTQPNQTEKQQNRP